MVSINSNAASASALQNLRNINSAIEQVQSRLSTGLRIGEARDNAAYWSIVTTLRSDQKTAATIVDGLHVGVASVDIAYNAHQTTTELLESYRSKIVSALRREIPREIAQEEVDHIKSQLVLVASSSSIFGHNWVNIDTSDASVETSKKVVSSIDQPLQGATQLRTVEIDTKAIALLDKNPFDWGILDRPKRPLPTIVSDRSAVGTEEVSAKPASVRYDFSLAALQPDRKIYFQMEYDGSVTPGGSWPGVLVPMGGYASVLEFATALGAEMRGDADVTVVPGESAITISTKTAGHASSISIRQVVVYKDGGYVRDRSDPLEQYVPIVGDGGQDSVPFLAASTSIPFAEPFSLIDEQSIAFTLTVDSHSARRVVINKTLIDRVTGRVDGRVANALEFQRVMQSAINQSGDAGVTIDVQLDAIRIRSSALSGPTSITIADVTVTSGVSVMEIELASKSDEELRGYFSVLDRAINASIAASAYLGALSARISTQASLMQRYADTIRRGISSLADADVESESIKIQALQVKRELGLQSLSIANVASKNLIVLFQNM